MLKMAGDFGCTVSKGQLVYIHGNLYDPLIIEAVYERETRQNTHGQSQMSRYFPHDVDIEKCIPVVPKTLAKLCQMVTK